MSLFRSNSGFSAVMVILVIAVIGIVGLVSYNVYDRQQTPQTTAEISNQKSQNQTPNGVRPAPPINSTNDLSSAEKTLDETSVSDNQDSSQLDAEMAAF